MPLTPFQGNVVEVLRPFRDPHSYVAGGVALNQNMLRLSDDLDIFRDIPDGLPNQVEPEIAALRDARFRVEITTSNDWMVEAIVRAYGTETRVQWLSDEESTYRFYPAIEDAELGFRIHQADAAVNKALCASRREQARDAVDIALIAKNYAPLGPLIWAAAGKKEVKIAPIQIARDMRDRIFGFSDAHIETVRTLAGETMTRDEMRDIVRPAIEAAIDYVENTAPEQHFGCLFVDNNQNPIEADEAALKSAKATAMPIKKFPPEVTIGASSGR